MKAFLITEPAKGHAENFLISCARGSIRGNEIASRGLVPTRGYLVQSCARDNFVSACPFAGSVDSISTTSRCFFDDVGH